MQFEVDNTTAGVVIVGLALGYMYLESPPAVQADARVYFYGVLAAAAISITVSLLYMTGTMAYGDWKRRRSRNASNHDRD